MARYNLAPMSSAWWVGWRCMLGLAPNSKTTENIIRSGECVLNLPSADLVGAVDRLARTTGSEPVPPGKQWRGYRHEKDKFGRCGLDGRSAAIPSPPRARWNVRCRSRQSSRHVHEHGAGRHRLARQYQRRSRCG